MRLLTIVVACLLSFSSFAQNEQFEIKSQGENLSKIIKGLEKRYGLKSSFNPKEISKYEYTGELSADSPEALIDLLLSKFPLKQKKAGEVHLLIPDATKPKPIQGKVIDGLSGRPLAFAHVKVDDSGTISSKEGAFKVIPSRDSLEITIQHIGYKPQTIKVYEGLENMDIRLVPDTQVLPNFIIDGTLDKGKTNAPGQLSINPQQINSLPTLGEPDVFKSLQLLPGIQATDESASGLVVRGGTTDQNLILMDGFTLYHLDHFLGIFSTFNPYTINNVDIYKGGFSARYGGRISSVVDAQGKGATRDEFHGGLGLSLTSVNGYVETPIAKNVSWVAGLRLSQSFISDVIYDQFLDDNRVDILQASEPDLERNDIDIDPSFSFYDFTSKIRWEVSPKSLIDFNVYLSEDFYEGSFVEEDEFSSFQFRDEASWSNFGSSIVWSHQANQNYLSEVTASLSSYGSSSLINQRYEGITFDFNDLSEEEIEQLSLNELFSLADSLNFEFGLDRENSINDFSLQWQNDLTISDESNLYLGLGLSAYDAYYTESFFEEDFTPDREIINEASALLSLFGEYQFAPRDWQFNAGLRFNQYELTNRLDLEPRLSAQYFLNDNFKLKGSWSQHNQYVNRISASPFGNSDQFQWVLADEDEIPVLSSEHAIVGFESQFGNWTFDAEAYRKTSTGILESEFLLVRTEDFEEDFQRSGENFSRGIDVLLKYKERDFSSWLSYGLGFSENLIPNVAENNRYWSDVDQRHEFNHVTQYQLGRWQFSSVFIYGSGKPFTPPKEILEESSDALFDVSRINSERLPTYHRLDLSAKYSADVKKIRLETGITLFNVYNRRNIRTRYHAFRFGYDEEIDQETVSAAPIDLQLLGITPNLFFNIHF